jgi:hypothetical protein
VKLQFENFESGTNLAAAYEMDDFVAVAGLNGGIGPLQAGEDFKIAFDGYAGGGEIQVTE